MKMIKRIGCLLVCIALTAAIAAGQDEHEGHDHAPATKPSQVEDHHDHNEQLHNEQAHAEKGHGEEAHNEQAHGEVGHSEEAHGEEGHEEGHVDEVTLTPEAIQRYGIKVGPISRHSLSPTFIAPARVSFNTEAMAHVGSLVQGRVTELKARVGDTVKEGDELLIVESPALGEAQSDYLQKRTVVTVAASAVEPAKTAYERGKVLHEQNEGIALAEVQRREAEYKAAQGALQTAQAAVAAAENRLRLLGMDQQAVETLVKSGEINPHYVVRAPISGQVIQREVTLGELVSPEKDALLILANMETLWVLAEVPEAQAGEIAVGSTAHIQVAAMPKKTFEGKVSHVAPALNENTRTARVRIEVSNNDAALKPGMFAKAELSAARQAGETTDAVLAVPDEAIQTVEGSPAVFVPVEGEANTFAKRAVTVGQPVGGMVPILSGLKEGEIIVTHETFILKAELGKAGAAHEH